MSDVKSKSTGGLESTECIIQKVFAFAVPPRTSTTGYRAADWPKIPLWSGRLRVVSRDGKLTILMEHTDKDGLFAQCPYENKSTVEPATDSSRYFVLRISDGKGRHAYIGIGFDKREEAFDFKVALQDAENAENSEDAVAYLSAPSQDLSLHQGEKN